MIDTFYRKGEKHLLNVLEIVHMSFCWVQCASALCSPTRHEVKTRAVTLKQQLNT